MSCNFCYAPLTLTFDETGWECRLCKSNRWPTTPVLKEEVKEESKLPLEETKEAA